MTPRGLRLRVLGTHVDVAFEAGITREAEESLRKAWRRCTMGDSADQHSGDRYSADQYSADPHTGRAAGSAHPARPFQATVQGPNGARVVAEDSLERFASELTTAVTLCGIEARAGDLLMLHAAGIADPVTGRAVAFVGPSGMGKTTATLTLGAEWGYVTDETVGIERSGTLVSYAKPLSVVVDSPRRPKRQVGPDELALRVAPHEASLRAVVLLDRREERVAGARAVVVDHAEAVIGLAPHTSSLARAHRPLQWLCSVLDACGGAVRVEYSDAGDLAALVPDLLNRPAVPQIWASALGPEARSGLAGGAPGRDVVRRAEVVDAVWFPSADGGEELMVMVDHRVVRLGGIAPAIWRSLRIPLTLAGIAECLAPEVGLPDGYEESLAAAVTELEAHGLVERSP